MICIKKNNLSNSFLQIVILNQYVLQGKQSEALCKGHTLKYNLFQQNSEAIQNKKTHLHEQTAE